MDIKNRADILSFGDLCGRIQGLYDSQNISIAYVKIEENAISHKHDKMEEVYYILKGEGIIQIGKERRKIGVDDVISIPKGEYHHLENTSKEPLELIVVTHPRYDSTDVHKKE
ncbi:MAG: cupin domain-containing protein [Nanoarchaeota archaeon]|nr:cupin domain-containing protein [Nanoarchaeota archaeon]